MKMLWSFQNVIEYLEHIIRKMEKLLKEGDERALC